MPSTASEPGPRTFSVLASLLNGLWTRACSQLALQRAVDRNLLAGQQGLSVAFDLATHRGYDS
eukprot:38638-Eustigmatos_ZCMA.PRE.1